MPRTRKTNRKPPSNRINTEELQAYAAQLLSIGMKKGDVKRHLYKKARRRINPNVVEQILSEARALLITTTGKTEEELKNENYAFYKGLIFDQKAGNWLKLKAAELIQKLCGLEGPVKVELSGGLAHTAKVAASLIRDENVAALLDKLDDTLAGKREAEPKPDEVPHVHARDARPGKPTRAR